MPPLRVRCYLDGLNFYSFISTPLFLQGVARKIDFKWIDLEALFTRILKERLNREISIEKLTFFASTVSGEAPAARQKNYYDALKKHSQCIVIQLGRFKEVSKRGRLLPEGEIRKMIVREEKETDVNIAVSMVDDAHTSAGKDFDVACLISNDSDMNSALGIVIRKMQQKVVLLCPVVDNTKIARSLAQHVPRQYRVSKISPSLVKDCSLPPEVDGHKPPQFKGWQLPSIYFPYNND